MNKKFDERLMMTDSTEGRNVRDNILDRYEAWEEKQHDYELAMEMNKAIKEADKEKLVSMWEGIHGKGVPEDMIKAIDKTIETEKKIAALEKQIQEKEMEMQETKRKLRELQIRNENIETKTTD
jgi:hypothetical protein